MHFKILILSVACCAFFIKPAHSGAILSTAGNTVSDLIQIGSKMVKAKGTAVAKVVGDMVAIAATGAGLKVRAIGNAASSFKGAASDALMSLGDTISEVGTNITSRNARRYRPVVEEVVEEVKVKTPTTIVEADVIEPCEEEVVEVPVESYPLRTVQVKIREPMTVIEPAPRMPVYSSKTSNVWHLLRNAAEARGARKIFTANSRNPFVYEIVNTPRVYRGPSAGSFYIQKK